MNNKPSTDDRETIDRAAVEEMADLVAMAAAEAAMTKHDRETDIKTYDEVKRIGILSGKPPTEVKAGPRRRPPRYYAGEVYAGHRINYPDVERYDNGAVPGIRDKAARRIIRGALKRRYSKVERDRRLGQGMLAQARELAHDENPRAKSCAKGRWAKRLFERELAIHQERTASLGRSQRRAIDRKLKKAGKKDAISQLVDAMVGGKL